MKKVTYRFTLELFDGAGMVETSPTPPIQIEYTGIQPAFIIHGINIYQSLGVKNFLVQTVLVKNLKERKL